MEHIWKYIKADQFFPVYCPDITNWKRKISGKNGRGNPLEFNEEEKKHIKKGLKQFFADFS